MQIGMLFRKAVSGFCAVAALCWVSAAWAGPELDSLRADLQRYYTEQSKNPNKIIRYSDANGFVAKAILDPQRINKAYAEVRRENYPYTGFSRYGVALDDYQTAFEKIYGEYDSEFLDAMETAFLMGVFSIESISRLIENSTTNSNNQAADFRKTLISLKPALVDLPNQITKLLSDSIKNKKFQPDMIPAATTRLEKLKAMQKAIKV